MSGEAGIVDNKSPLYGVTSSVLTTTQPVWDGGIINFTLRNTQYVNSKFSLTASPADHVIKTILSGGYFAGLVCGLLWSILLMIIGFGLCICHCIPYSKCKAAVMISQVGDRIQKKFGEMGKSFPAKAVQCILSNSFVFIAFIMCILAFVANSHLHSAVSSIQREDAMIPSMARSVNNLYDYVKRFAPHAREATKPIVDELVQKAEQLLYSSPERFYDALAKKMKIPFFQKNIIMLGDYFSKVKESSKIITDSENELSKIVPVLIHYFKNAKKGITKCCNQIEQYRVKSNSLDEVSAQMGKCNPIKKSFFKSSDGRRFNFDSNKVDLENMSALANVSGKYNFNSSAVTAVMNSTFEEKEAMKERLLERLKNTSNVGETLRSMVGKQWKELDLKLKNVSVSSESITKFLYNDIHHKVVKFERIRNAVYVVAIGFLMVICVFGAVNYNHHFFAPHQLSTRRRNAYKISMYFSLIIWSFAVIVCMGTFLVGGYAWTEACRYLEEPPQKSGEHSAMYLDKMFNDWMNKHWRAIAVNISEGSSIIIQRPPRDVFYGLQTSCRSNRSITSAMHLLDMMNTSSVSTPEMIERLLRRGRELMHKGIRNINISHILDSTTKRDMAQLLDLIEDNIINGNHQYHIDRLNRSLLQIKAVSPLIKNIVKAQEQFDSYVQNDAADDVSTSCTTAATALRELTTNVDAFKNEMINQRQAFIDLKNLKNTSDTVYTMYPTFHTVLDYVNNVTKLIEDADAMYDESIGEIVRNRSSQMIVDLIKGVMSVVGPCRLLYKAYNDIVYVPCAVVVQSLNSMWFFIGSSLLFLMPYIVFAKLIWAIHTETHIDRNLQSAEALVEGKPQSTEALIEGEPQSTTE